MENHILRHTISRRSTPTASNRTTRSKTRTDPCCLARHGSRRRYARPEHQELRDQIIEYCAVKVEGLGTWTPTIASDGALDIQCRPDLAFNYGLKIPGIFSGTIINRENIGKTSEELVQMWNTQFPDDQVVFSES